MTKTRSFLLTAGMVLAMAFTFSCSSDDGGSGNSRATYWYSMYGVNEASYNRISDLGNQYENPSYDDIKNMWSELNKIGTWIESYGGVSEQEIKDYLIQRGVSPKDADGWLALLKKRGNMMGAFGYPSYYAVFIYVERE